MRERFIQLGFFSVPSAGSTYEMLFRVRKDRGLSSQHPASAATRSRFIMTLLIIATLAVTIFSLIPLITIIHPPIVNLIVPFMANPSEMMKNICLLFLVAGNVLTFAAVAALRSHVSFHHFGETTQLHTSGIYGQLRNPITVGLTLIYAGFFLALPSAAMLIGFLIFLLNSSYRIKMEEIYYELNHPSFFRLNLRLRKISNIPIVAIVHQVLCRQPRSGLLNRLYETIERPDLNSVDGLIFNSNTTRQTVEQLIGNRRPSIVAFPAGDRLGYMASTDLIESRTRAPGPLKLIFVGNVLPNKWLMPLIRDLAQLPCETWP